MRRFIQVQRSGAEILLRRPDVWTVPRLLREQHKTHAGGHANKKLQVRIEKLSRTSMYRYFKISFTLHRFIRYIALKV